MKNKWLKKTRMIMTEVDKERIKEQIKKNKYDLRKIIDLLPCSSCKWRYGLHCPHCSWNRKGKYQVY